MEPVRLTNQNLKQLRTAKYQLQQFDDVLQRHLNKHFAIQYIF